MTKSVEANVVVINAPTVDAKDKAIKALIKSSGSHQMSVSFKKKDGTDRLLGFNPREGVKLTKPNKSASTAQAVKTRKANNPHIINVVDGSIANRETDRAKGWRSFDTERVEELRVNGVCYKFQ